MAADSLATRPEPQSSLSAETLDIETAVPILITEGLAAHPGLVRLRRHHRPKLIDAFVHYVLAQALRPLSLRAVVIPPLPQSPRKTM